MGIDNGTQGLTVLLVDICIPTLPILATGEATYGFIDDCCPSPLKPQPGQPCQHQPAEASNIAGRYEQRASDWEDALQSSLDQIRTQINEYDIVAVGVVGQMHGQVMVDRQGSVLGSVRLWCDSRNADEAQEISDWFSISTVPLPKRLTAARWLWTMKYQPELAQTTDFLTTPAGWLSFLLTDGASKTLGIGDASGMFPMDATTRSYRQDWLDIYDTKVAQSFPGMPLLSTILPQVHLCGQDAGRIGARAAERFGLPVGIPIAPAEGDQPAALVGSLIAKQGLASCSFGTSVCANIVGSPMPVGASSFSRSTNTDEDDRLLHSPTTISSPLVNHFSAVNGQPIYMVWLRNGTTFLNRMVASYSNVGAATAGGGTPPDFATIMPLVLQAPDDCGGLVSLPFLDDEPGLQVHEGGTAMILGWNNDTTGSRGEDAGCVCKSALLATMFNLKQGIEYLKSRGIALEELLWSGGLTKTPDCGQLLANVLEIPVRLVQGAEEGCSWGAAVLANYRYKNIHRTMTTKENPVGGVTNDEVMNDWVNYCRSIPPLPSRIFTPQPASVSTLGRMYKKYQRLLALQSQLHGVVSS